MMCVHTACVRSPNVCTCPEFFSLLLGTNATGMKFNFPSFCSIYAMLMLSYYVTVSGINAGTITDKITHLNSS